jgi:hypothetical protein
MTEHQKRAIVRKLALLPGVQTARDFLEPSLFPTDGVPKAVPERVSPATRDNRSDRHQERTKRKVWCTDPYILKCTAAATSAWTTELPRPGVERWQYGAV